MRPRQVEADLAFGPTFDPDSPKRPAALRRNIAEAVRLLSRKPRRVADVVTQCKKTV